MTRDDGNTADDVTCADLREHLAALVDGDAVVLERFVDHLASCDACRDLRHEAQSVPAQVKYSGDDFAVPEDLQDRLLARIDEPSTARSSAVAITGETPQRPHKDIPKKKTAGRSGPEARSGRWLWPAVAAALAASAVAALAIHQGTPGGRQQTTARQTPGQDSGLRGAGEAVSAGYASVIGVIRSGGGAGGVELCSAGFAGRAGEKAGAKNPGAKKTGAHCVVWNKGHRIPAGSSIRTDAQTRARVLLPDRTTVVLDHHTEVTFSGGRTQLALRRGRLVAEVVPRRAGGSTPPLRVSVPTGEIEVLGTRFLLTATRAGASVRVTRGRVRLLGGKGQALVNPGQEGLLPRSGPARVVPGGSLADAVSWAELSPPGDHSVVGLGELRARKPGDAPDRERPLSIAQQKVTVRIVGNVARTEVRQSFSNDTGHVLEGIYKFPLPPDARIERLALDVKGAPGGFEEGALVDRQRAKKIWAGVIRNATPKQKRKKKTEYIWVPGPWRDPALLEWQRGSNFELRIFPIPKHGQRTIILAYTQVVAPSGDGRRYVYPLAHASDSSTQVGRFDLDLRVAHRATEPVRFRGYPMTTERRGGTTRLSYSKQRFVPSGDLVIDYRLPARAELQYWTFAGDVATAPGASAGRRSRRGTSAHAAVVAAQRKLAADTRPFVLFSLRPRLPRWSSFRPRDYAIVIDSSQSMVGERYARAVRLAAALVAEMDRRDRVTVMTCDFHCRSVTEGLVQPGKEQARALRRALDALTPAGSSNLAEAIRRGVRQLKPAAGSGRMLQLLLIGDGMPSVGHRSPAALARIAGRLAGTSHSVTTVGIGADADAAVLSAVARGGRGHFIPYVPGQSIGVAALNVLQTAYGVTLDEPRLEFPAGVVELAPRRLPNLRAGQELLVAARFSGRVEGQVVLRGRLDNEPFSRRYNVKLERASTSRGNAFVPRQWAALAIQELEFEARGDGRRASIVALSRAFGVMSRHTSLLVLESPAMFSAFGVDRQRPATMTWTGDEAPVTGTAAAADPPPAARPSTRGGGRRASAPRRSRRSRDSLDDLIDGSLGAKPSREPRRRPRRRRPGRWMKRVWVRVGSISADPAVRGGEQSAVARATRAVADSPHSRDRQRRLVRALSRAGQLEQAHRAAQQWLARDQLDAEALVYLADTVGRRGERQEAMRLLSGIVDLEPDSGLYHRRLMAAFGRAGMLRRVCDHQVALAEATNKVADLGPAVRCRRGHGDDTSAGWLLSRARDGSARLRIERLAARPAAAERVRGEIMLDASWGGEADLDLSLITPQGTRISWLGGRRSVAARDATRAGHELLVLRRGSVGSYLIELSRTAGPAALPVSGTVRVTAPGVRRTLRFRLEGARAVIGRVNIRRESHMEQVQGQERIEAGLSAPTGLPERLTRSQILAVMNRTRDRVRSCHERYKVPGLARVQITIQRNGRISSVRVRGVFADTPSGACVARAVRTARFPRFLGAPINITFPFILR